MACFTASNVLVTNLKKLLKVQYLGLITIDNYSHIYTHIYIYTSKKHTQNK